MLVRGAAPVAGETGDALPHPLSSLALKSIALKETVRQPWLCVEEVMPVFLALLPAALSARRAYCWGDSRTIFNNKSAANTGSRHFFTKGFCLSCPPHISVCFLFCLRSDTRRTKTRRRR